MLKEMDLILVLFLCSGHLTFFLLCKLCVTLHNLTSSSPYPSDVNFLYITQSYMQHSERELTIFYEVPFLSSVTDYMRTVEQPLYVSSLLRSLSFFNLTFLRSR